MRIAIIGAGVAGLTAAHRLDPRHDVTVFEAGATSAATRTRSRSTTRTPERSRSTPASSSSTTATTRTSRRCSTSSASPRSRRTWASRSRPRRADDFEYAGTPARPVRQPRNLVAPVRSTGWSATCCASTASSSASCSAAANAARSARLLERRRLLPALRRAADRPPGRRRLVGRPRADVDASRPASSPSSSTTTACSSLRDRPQWRTVAGGSHTLRRGARRAACARPVRAGDAGRARSTPAREPRRGRRRDGGDAERFDEVVIAVPHRPGAGAARRPERRPSARSSARSPTRRTRRSCTPTRRCCRAAARAWASWNFHLLDRAARPARRSPTG